MTKKSKNITNQLFAVSKRVGMAIGDYDMIQEGDRILIGISGGKDSLSLIRLLKYRQGFAPVRYEILAGFVDMRIPDFPLQRLKDYLAQEDVPLHIQEIDILKGKSMADLNCFWCSWNRRKALFQMASRLNCNKIALGHHLDDIVETILMNMFYRGEIGAMCPKQEMFRGELTIIRPLAYEDESEIVRLIDKEHIPTFDDCKCPHDETTKRKQLKDLISALTKDNPAVKKNIFNSLKNIKSDYLT